jgi:HAD superfamily phosphoserine phosphatase-like hydrolase
MVKNFYSFNRQYFEISKGVSLRKGVNVTVVKAFLDNIKYAFFDLDGTIYPSLFILDVTKKIFKDHALHREENYIKKKVSLDALIASSSHLPFQEIYNRFICLLEDESLTEFVSCSKTYLPKICIGVKEFIQFLQHNGTKCILVSLTPNFIAKVIKESLELDGYLGIDYRTKTIDDKKLFMGSYKIPCADFSTFKKTVLKQYNLDKIDKPKIFFAGDSLEDIGLFNSAGITLAVNPKEQLLERKHFDIVLRDFNTLPWKKLAALIQ